jgi:hypothetical protein
MIFPRGISKGWVNSIALAWALFPDRQVRMMSVDDVSDKLLGNRLLSDEERTFCQNILHSGEGLYKQRAAALLALDAGSSRTEVGQETGLTRGQVRYLVETFRQKHLRMFPQEDLMDMEAQPLAIESSLEMEEVAAKDVKVDKPSVTKEKSKKGKKKQKKEKKAKTKGKKMAKKGKKPKKKDGAKAKGKKGKGKSGKKGKGKSGKKK